MWHEALFWGNKPTKAPRGDQTTATAKRGHGIMHLVTFQRDCELHFSQWAWGQMTSWTRSARSCAATGKRNQFSNGENSTAKRKKKRKAIVKAESGKTNVWRQKWGEVTICATGPLLTGSELHPRCRCIWIIDATSQLVTHHAAQCGRRTIQQIQLRPLFALSTTHTTTIGEKSLKERPRFPLSGAEISRIRSAVVAAASTNVLSISPPRMLRRCRSR